MLSALGGVVGDSAVQRAHRAWADAWRFKHPSPWDYVFFMDRALGRDLGWFWRGGCSAPRARTARSPASPPRAGARR
jgi:hypothetical protein